MLVPPGSAAVYSGSVVDASMVWTTATVCGSTGPLLRAYTLTRTGLNQSALVKVAK